MKNGFVLLMVIMILFFISTILFVFTSVSNEIVFQTNQSYLKAVGQNMASSGIAWAKNNKSNTGNTELDTAGIAPPNSQLSITAERDSQVMIKASCGRGRQLSQIRLRVLN